MHIKYNDYMLLDLINEGSDEALEIMFSKYNNLIIKKVYKFHLENEFDDMVQEGKLMLYQSIIKYDDRFGKTFTNYFIMNLERKFMTLSNKRIRRKTIFYQNIHYLASKNILEEPILYDTFEEVEEVLKILTKIEKIVYTMRVIDNLKVEEIHEITGYSQKIIYNALYRAKNKIKKQRKADILDKL